MLIPVGVVVSAGLMAWNSDCAKGDRELEGRFLREYPQTFARISQRVSAGEGVATIAAEYGQMFRAYRKSDRAALAQLTATVSAETQAQTELQNPASMPTSNRQEPIAPGVAAAAPSMSVVNGVETIAPRDIATDLGNNPQSALIFGTPGAGKGMNISNAIRTLRAKYPKLTIMMVDPKGNPAERGYWQNQVDIFESKAILKTHPRRYRLKPRHRAAFKTGELTTRPGRNHQPLHRLSYSRSRLTSLPPPPPRRRFQSSME